MLFEGQDGPKVHEWKFAGPIERAYELSRGPCTMIEGPTGGGKTTGSARRYLRVATWQHPSPKDGKRKARILCLCPTYRRAWDTIIPSWLKTWPKTLGTFRGSMGDPADHVFEIKVAVNGVPTVCRIEALFRAINDQEIEEFFRGFEITAMHLPEADTQGDLDQVLSLGRNRCGRYPEPDDRPDEQAEIAYKGIFGDANAPIIGSAYHRRFHLKRMADGRPAPKTDILYRQPGGYSPNAENIQNLRKIDPNYYETMAAELDAYDVERLIKNKPGFGRHGQAVHPNFDIDVHKATRTIDLDPLLEVFIGVDAGSGSLVPGVTFNQRAYSGQWRTLAEIFLPPGDTLNTEQLGQRIREIMNSHRFQRAKGAMICVDPAARDRSAHTEVTTAQYLQAYSGIEVQFAPTNDAKLRRSAMDKLFLKMVGPKEPAKLIDPDCVGLLQGYAGGFHYQKRGQAVSVAPVKNEFSHVCEADEYVPLTVEGLDAREGRFIRQDGEEVHVAPTTLADW